MSCFHAFVCGLLKIVIALKPKVNCYVLSLYDLICAGTRSSFKMPMFIDWLGIWGKTDNKITVTLHSVCIDDG